MKWKETKSTFYDLDRYTFRGLEVIQKLNNNDSYWRIYLVWYLEYKWLRFVYLSCSSFILL